MEGASRISETLVASESKILKKIIVAHVKYMFTGITRTIKQEQLVQSTDAHKMPTYQL